jgi:hypothetical protein
MHAASSWSIRSSLDIASTKSSALTISDGRLSSGLSRILLSLS